jgi:hypothetical protein
MTLLKSRRASLWRRQSRRGPPTITKHPGGRQCRHSECRERMCTPLWSKLQRQLPGRVGKPDPVRPPHCCVHCRRLPPTGYAKPRAGSPTGWKNTKTPLRCQIWPIRWRAAAPIDRCARRSSPLVLRTWSRDCVRSRRGMFRIRAPWGRTTEARYGCFQGKVRSGRRWGPTCSPTNLCSPPPLRRLNR